MYQIITDYKTTGEFLKEYRKQYKDGSSRPITRAALLAHIRKEKANPGTTGLDVLEVSGLHLVRYSSPPEGLQATNSDSRDTSPGEILDAIVGDLKPDL
jgi:hypothetical protein